MTEYSIDILGTFDCTEIRSVVDRHGKYWFTQEVVSQALDVDRTTVTRARQNHPEFFTDDDFDTILFEGRNHVVFSEEGFLTVCDLSNSEKAVRLRKWMRQQFRVKQQGDQIIVQSKKMPQDDLSDLDPELAIIQKMLNELAENRRRMRVLESDQRILSEAQTEIQGHVHELESRIASWEDGAKLHPGELTAIQLAQHCGWQSKSGGAHNVAVILAATNEGFRERKLMDARREQGPDGRVVEVCVFTTAGIAAFLTEIDAKHAAGQVFEIAPNDIAKKHGMKNKRNIIKRASVSAALPAAPPMPGPVTVSLRKSRNNQASGSAG